MKSFRIIAEEELKAQAIAELEQLIEEYKVNEILGFAITDTTRAKIMNSIEKAVNASDEGLMLIYDVKKSIIAMIKKAKNKDEKKVLNTAAEEVQNLIKHGSGEELTKSSILDDMEQAVARA